MKQLIKDVLDDMSTGQINLSSSSARELIATTITAALKTKGSYKEYTDYEFDEQKAIASWVCDICGKSTYELDYDYIGSGANHLSCELRLEQDEKYRKKNRYQKKEVLESRVVDDAGVDIETGKYVGDPGVKREKNWSQKKHEEKVDWFDDKTMSSLTRTSDRRESDRREKNWSQKKHEDKVFGNDNNN